MKTHPIVSAILVIAILVGGMAVLPAFAEKFQFPPQPTTRQIQRIHYDVRSGELVVENQGGVPVAPANVLHHVKKKRVEFFLPSTMVTPSPRVIKVQGDPIVKEIELSQGAVQGNPAVKVQVHLYTKAPYIPLQFHPTQPGLKAIIGRVDPKAPSSQPITTQAPATQVQQQPVQSKPVRKEGYHRPVQPLGQQHQQAHQQPQPRYQHPAPSQQQRPTVVGQPHVAGASVIDDAFYEAGGLHIVSGQTPINVERTFLLEEPDRYVLDITPAVLASKQIARAIPENNPNVINFDVGQFDDDTVRVVVRFSNGPLPIEVNRLHHNKVLKLSF